jgi:hypothetical protein
MAVPFNVRNGWEADVAFSGRASDTPSEGVLYLGENGSGWLLILTFYGLVNPIVVIIGIASGLVVRRWWQVSLGLVTAPAAYWMYLLVFSNADRVGSLFPPLAVAGVTWSATAFGVKKASSD